MIDDTEYPVPLSHLDTLPAIPSVTNPYEQTAYGLPELPPPPPKVKKRLLLKSVVCFAFVLVMIGMAFSTFVVGKASVTVPNVNATATAAYHSGYDNGNTSGYNSGLSDGQAQQAQLDLTSEQATATASYTSGQQDEDQSLYNFLYNGDTASGQPCQVANITDSQGNSDYRYVRLYKDSAGTIHEECIA